jgi:hypothetical protein
MKMHELRPGQHTRVTQQPLLAFVMVPTAELPSTPQCRQVPLLDPIHSPHPACCLLFAPQVALITERIFGAVIKNHCALMEVRGCQVGHHGRPQAPVSRCWCSSCLHMALSGLLQHCNCFSTTLAQSAAGLWSPLPTSKTLGSKLATTLDRWAPDCTTCKQARPRVCPLSYVLLSTPAERGSVWGLVRYQAGRLCVDTAG